MAVIQSMNLALRFLLELCALAGVGYWGFRPQRGLALRFLLGLGAPLLIAALWGTFGAPKANRLLTGPFHLLLELGVFGLPAVALYTAGRPTWAWAYGSAVVINRALMFVWNQ